MGGYKIIDLKDVNLVTDGGGVKIEDIYNAIEESYRKPLLLSGIVIDGVEKNDRYVAFQHSDSEYHVLIDGKMLRIANGDTVTYTTSLA